MGGTSLAIGRRALKIGRGTPTIESVASNRTYHLSASDLQTHATVMLDQVEKAGAASLGLPQSVVDDLAAKAEALTTRNSAVFRAMMAYRGLVGAREQARAECADSIAALARRVYANETLDEAAIVAIGLEARKTTRTAVKPVAPTSLTVEPSPSGEVLLSWKRGANAKTVTFLVEAWGPGESPRFIKATTATRIRLTGYAPGVTAYFRVVASKGDLSAPPTLPVSIYEGMASKQAA